MTAQILNVLMYFFAGSGICSLACMILPSTHKNSFFQLLLDAANMWAFNFHKGENKDDTRP